MIDAVKLENNAVTKRNDRAVNLVLAMHAQCSGASVRTIFCL
jgi:hypothetical protein